MTVLEVIQRSTAYLAKRGVDSPRLQIELLLAHVLRLPRLQLYLNFERTLTEAELDAVRRLVQRRGEREPLQHLVGTTSFCGLEMLVSPQVLIPRPETELLAERAWCFLRSVGQARAGTRPPTALDFGTGSGCLAIALCVNCPEARVWAVDISPAGLALARANAARHQVAERVTLWRGDGLAAVAAGATFDLIVANPPYVPSGEVVSLQPEVRDHDPVLALDGGPDGLKFMRLLAGAGAHVAEGGKLMLEFGDGQAEQVRALFETQGWHVEAIEPDYTGRPRILVAQRGPA